MARDCRLWQWERPPGRGIADHALVFIFRPFNEDWVQPFACFATKGAAKGDVLYELITKAICMLFNHSAIVKNCTSDGHQTNKKAASLFGITFLNLCKSYFLHPLDCNIKIYWFVDVPHVLKCVRNHILTHKIVQVYFSIISHFFKNIPLTKMCFSMLARW